MTILLPLGIRHCIKYRKSPLYIAVELIFTVTAFILVISYWNQNLSSILGFYVIPLTLFVIIWGCYSTTVTVKEIDSSKAKFEKFPTEFWLLKQLPLSPIYIIGVLQSIRLLNS